MTPTNGHAGAFPSNIYGFEFRFRAKSFELDESVISCPIKRTACTYIGNILVECSTLLDKTYLSAYHVRVQVKEVFRDWTVGLDDDSIDDTSDYGESWWSVLSCEVAVTETLVPPAYITESVKFWWTPTVYHYDFLQLGFYTLIGFGVFLAFWMLYIATDCVICGKKSAILNRNDICYVCLLYGSELPPPEVLERLRREKAARHNHSINRNAMRQALLHGCTLLGVHQLTPPRLRDCSPRICCYIFLDIGSDLWTHLKRVALTAALEVRAAWAAFLRTRCGRCLARCSWACLLRLSCGLAADEAFLSEWRGRRQACTGALGAALGCVLSALTRPCSRRVHPEDASDDDDSDGDGEQAASRARCGARCAAALCCGVCRHGASGDSEEEAEGRAKASKGVTTVQVLARHKAKHNRHDEGDTADLEKKSRARTPASVPVSDDESDDEDPPPSPRKDHRGAK